MSKNDDNDKKIEDDLTVSDMSADWMPWNSGIRRHFRQKKAKIPERKESVEEKKAKKKEYRQLVLAQFLAMLPAMVCVLLAFAAMFLLAYLWLR